MSLIYSVHQPNQPWSRTTVIAFVLALYAAVLMAFNNGIGSLLFTAPAPPFKNIDIKPDPKPYVFAPPPQAPPVTQEPALQPPPVEVGKVTPDTNTETKDIASSPTDTAVSGEQKITINPAPVSRVGITYRVDPAYPASAERAGEEGTVLLEIQVDPLGRAMAVQVARSSGFHALDMAAVRAVKQWKFHHPSATIKVRVPVTFKLSQQF